MQGEMKKEKSIHNCMELECYTEIFKMKGRIYNKSILLLAHELSLKTLKNNGKLKFLSQKSATGSSIPNALYLIGIALK